MIETVYNWLRGLPGLEGLKTECLDAAPGSSGLFCKGLKTLSRSEDILGGVRIRQSLTFLLSLHSTARQVPELFLHPDTSAAPVLGENQTLTVTAGHLNRDNGTGICRYEATITFTFTSEG